MEDNAETRLARVAALGVGNGKVLVEPRDILDVLVDVRRLRTLLHDADATPLAEVATELAAARENVAGTAALLAEANAEVERLKAMLERTRHLAIADARRAERERCIAALQADLKIAARNASYDNGNRETALEDAIETLSELGDQDPPTTPA